MTPSKRKTGATAATVARKIRTTLGIFRTGKTPDYVVKRINLDVALNHATFGISRKDNSRWITATAAERILKNCPEIYSIILDSGNNTMLCVKARVLITNADVAAEKKKHDKAVEQSLGGLGALFQ